MESSRALADTLNDCAARSHNYPGMRATQADASSGASFPAFKALFEKEAKSNELPSLLPGRGQNKCFLAALEAKSADPIEITKHIVAITNDPGASIPLSSSVTPSRQ
jgi:branched-chain amino acid transport system substrate-binding protein